MGIKIISAIAEHSVRICDACNIDDETHKDKFAGQTSLTFELYALTAQGKPGSIVSTQLIFCDDCSSLVHHAIKTTINEVRESVAAKKIASEVVGAAPKTRDWNSTGK